MPVARPPGPLILPSPGDSTNDQDLVVWSGDPFSVYTRAEQVYIEGRRVYERANPGPPRSDFELGLRGAK